MVFSSSAIYIGLVVGVGIISMIVTANHHVEAGLHRFFSSCLHILGVLLAAAFICIGSLTLIVSLLGAQCWVLGYQR